MSALMPTYAPADIAFDRGAGCRLWTTDGREYLDFAGGIATSSLGHNHPGLVAAIAGQAARLIHISNLFRIPEAERLARRLTESCFADRAFFCNSGAEANEGSVKLVRRWQATRGARQRWRMICLQGAFHGRTLAMLAATGNPKYSKDFGPVVPGFDNVAMDLDAVAAAIGPETAGIMVEPVQGEGGVRVSPAGFLAGLRDLCDRHDLLLVFDEVQSGMGRTGRMFAHQHEGVTPDVMSIAKGIAGGFPMGAFLSTEAVASCLAPGAHGTTFGGSPLACAAANAVMDAVTAPGFLEAVAARGERLRAGLEKLVATRHNVFPEARGRGLLLGLRCGPDAAAIATACRDEGLLTVTAGDNVIRLIPPLVVTEAECDEALAMLHRAADRIAAEAGERS